MTLTQVFIITALFLFCCQQIFAADQPIKIVNEKEKYYLQRGNDTKDRFLINYSELSVPVINIGKTSITFPPTDRYNNRGEREFPKVDDKITIKKNNKVVTIHSDDIKNICISDKMMGSHKEGNDIRYMNISGNGLFAAFTDHVVMKNDIYCIANIRSLWARGQTIYAQFLIVIHTSPTPSFKILKKLDFDFTYINTLITIFNSKLILTEKDKKNNTENVTNIEEIDKNGKTIKIIKQLPSGIKTEKFYQNRWLLCSDSEIKQSTNKQKKNSKNTEACACILLVDTFTLSIFDIKTKKTTKLPKQFIGNNANIIDTNDSMALIRYRETSNNSKFCTIAIPSGKVITIDNEGNGSSKLWKDLVVYKTGNKLKIYNSATGKLVKELLLPVTMKQ